MAGREFNVEGMTCGHCEMSVQEEISEVAGVTAVKADHTTGKITVEGDGYSTDDIAAAVKEAGYTLA